MGANARWKDILLYSDMSHHTYTRKEECAVHSIHTCSAQLSILAQGFIPIGADRSFAQV